MSSPTIRVTVPTRPPIQATAAVLPRVVVTATAAPRPPSIAVEIPAAIATALEPISGGDFVRFVDGGIRRADAALAAGAAQGFVRDAASVGTQVKVFTDGGLGEFAGLTPGAAYYLTTGNPGKVSRWPNRPLIYQHLGSAVDAQTLCVQIAPPIRTATTYMQPI